MRTTAGRAALASCLLLVASGCSTVGGLVRGDDVLDTGLEPVALTYDGPAYAALDGRDLLVRDGADEQRLRGAVSAGWLPDGRVLVHLHPRHGGVRVMDPATGPTGPTKRFTDDPSRGVTRLNVLDRLETFQLFSYDLDLALVETVPLPPTDNPDATEYNELERNYFGAVPTIGGVTFVKWHDGSEWYEDGDDGVLRIEGDDQRNVLVNENIVGLYLSADGTGLIGLRQSHGEPCGGCRVDQDLVEIDPRTGEIGAEYGVPDEYDAWRVGAIDKVGDRVAVRYYEPVERRGHMDYEQRGTWVYDGGWSLVEGSEDELSWWQGEGRVVARVAADEGRGGDGFDLFWVEDGEETPLPGELSSYPAGVPVEGAVAGQLLPPA